MQWLVGVHVVPTPMQSQLQLNQSRFLKCILRLGVVCFPKTWLINIISHTLPPKMCCLCIIYRLVCPSEAKETKHHGLVFNLEQEALQTVRPYRSSIRCILCCFVVLFHLCRSLEHNWLQPALVFVFNGDKYLVILINILLKKSQVSFKLIKFNKILK